MDCRVVVEAAVPVYDVETADEAIRIAIAKTGKMLNPDLSYVDIEMGTRTSPGGETLDPAFVAADDALVALELSMLVFNVDGTQHASRIARSEMGERLDGVPLKVVDHERVEDDDGATPTEDVDVESGPQNGDVTEDTDDADDDLLPEFEEMVEENRR
jgi:uncharacterized protein (UPF0212 family)